MQIPRTSDQMCCVPGYVSGYAWHGHAYALCVRCPLYSLFTLYLGGNTLWGVQRFRERYRHRRGAVHGMNFSSRYYARPAEVSTLFEVTIGFYIKVWV